MNEIQYQNEGKQKYVELALSLSLAQYQALQLIPNKDKWYWWYIYVHCWYIFYIHNSYFTKSIQLNVPLLITVITPHLSINNVGGDFICNQIRVAFSLTKW